VRQGPELPSAEVIEEGSHECPDRIRMIFHHLLHIDGEEREAVPEWSKPYKGVLVDVALANFEEPTVRCERFEALPDCRSCERVEDKVNAPSICRCTDLVGKVECSRVEWTLDAQCSKKLSLLFAAGSRENSGAGETCNLEGREPDTPGRGVNENRLSGADLPKMMERVPRGQKCDRDRHCFLERKFLRDSRDNPLRDRDVRGEASRVHGQYFVAEAH
jgi:hypothetical protein